MAVGDSLGKMNDTNIIPMGGNLEVSKHNTKMAKYSMIFIHYLILKIQETSS